MIAWLVTPIGRWLAGVWAALAFVGAVYWAGRRKGVEALRQEQEAERSRRMSNAIQADDDTRRRIAAGGLRDNDGHRRD